MAKALSIDLRERVIAAVNEGTSRREAAVRFGVSASSAIRWCALERETGDPRSKPQGGDRRSARIEAEASRILALVEERPDITLAERAKSQYTNDPSRMPVGRGQGTARGVSASAGSAKGCCAPQPW
jgi:transposase